MHPDTRTAPRKSGAPDFEEIHGHWQDRLGPMHEPISLARNMALYALIVLVAGAIVGLLGAAYFEGEARADARPAVCNGLTAAECSAAVVELR